MASVHDFQARTIDGQERSPCDGYRRYNSDAF